MAKIISMMGEFITAGERATAEILKQLPPSWTIILNKIITNNHGKSYEIDVIIVAKNWIFVLDEKSWRGQISGNDSNWKSDDYGYVPSPLQKLEYTARIVRGYLDRYLPRFKLYGRYVRSGVVLSAQEQVPVINDTRARDSIFCLADVCVRLQDLDAREGNPLIGECHAQIVECFVKLSNRQTLPQRIGCYTIIDSELIHDGMRKLHAHTDDDQLRILMVYDLGLDPTEQHALRDYYLKEYQALQQLQTTGVVPIAHDYFEWNDRFFVFSYDVVTGRSLEDTPYPTTLETVKVIIDIAHAAFQSLVAIHHKHILHRAIRPINVWIAKSKVVFTDFYAARAGTESIAERLNYLELSREDPYASPDLVVGYEFATEATDCYSLALVFLERITGQSVRIIQEHIVGRTDISELLRMWTMLPGNVLEELTQIFGWILFENGKVHDVVTADAIAKRLIMLSQKMTKKATSHETPLLLGEKFTLSNTHMCIERPLGQGRFSETFLAAYTDEPSLSSFVLKRLREPDQKRYEQCRSEYMKLLHLKSAYFPTIMEIYPLSSEFHIKMEYIPGQTLLQLESTFPWPIERWWRLAEHMLDALAVLEKNAIVHRDIKLANVIMHEDKDIPIIIDFGFAHQDGVSGMLQGSPLYLAPEIIRGDLIITSAQDRYAACVMLFKMLTGIYPRMNGKLIELEELTLSEIGLSVAQRLIQALDDDPTQRAQNVQELKACLAQAFAQSAVAQSLTAATEWRVNPWVDQMRSLYRNSIVGNSENRGLDTQVALSTYVHTMLDTTIFPEILQRKPPLVFFSGNPGDGKTAFLAQVERALIAQGAGVRWKDASGWEYTLAGHHYRSCYDASESADGKSADEQLAEKLRGVEGVAAPTLPLTIFVAINDGRQLDFFERYEKMYQWVREEAAAFRKNPDLLQRHVWVIDLKERALVHWPGQPSITNRIVTQFVTEERWQTCSSCAASFACPLYQNAQALRKEEIRSRLGYTLLLVHLRQRYHLTMRDLRSTLSYLIAGDTGCHEIHERVQHKDFAHLANLRYWNLAFTDEPIDEELLREIRALDPGMIAHPIFDRFLHYHRTQNEAPERSALFSDGADLSPLAFASNEQQWMIAFKRKYFFEAHKPDQQHHVSEAALPPPERLLPYTYAPQFIALLQHASQALGAVLPTLARGLLVSENVIDVLDTRFLSIVVKASESQHFLVLKQLPLTSFRLTHRTSAYRDIVETIEDALILSYNNHQLTLSLDLFELLSRMHHGQLPRSPEFQPLLEDLLIFKRRLQLEDAQELTLIDRANTIYRLTQHDGAITIKGVR